MAEHTISKEHMDSLKALADTNMKIGEARGTLVKLQEVETGYLVEREAKAVAVIQKVVENSADLLKEVKTNYREVHDLCSVASSFAEFLVEAYGSFSALKTAFDEKSTLWEAQVKEKEAEFAEIRKQIKQDNVLLANDKESLEKAKKALDIDRKKVVADRGEVERAIKRLKENRI